jgi:hypothetical protein
MASQSRTSPPGPFTGPATVAAAASSVAVSNLSGSSGVFVIVSLHKLTRPTSAPFRVRARRSYPASCPQPGRRRSRPSHRVSVSCCLSAAGVRFLGRPASARELGLPYGRLTRHCLDPGGVVTFYTIEIRPGRVPPIPRGRRCHLAAIPSSGQRRRFPVAGLSLAPTAPIGEPSLTRHQQGFTHVHPSGLPLHL